MIFTVLNAHPKMPVLRIENEYEDGDYHRYRFENIEQLDCLIQNLEMVKTFYQKGAK